MAIYKTFCTGRAIRWAFGRAAPSDKHPDGAVQICVMFRITEGDLRGHEHPWYGFLTPDAVDRTLRGLRDAGWTGDDLDPKMPGLGSCDVPITLEEDDETRTTRVAWVGGGDGVPLRTVLGDAELRAVSAALKKGGAIAKSKLPPEPVTGAVRKPRARGEDMPDDERFEGP